MGGSMVACSASFLVAVTALLTPLRLPRHAPCRRTPPARNAAESKGYGSFDAGAWESIASSAPAPPPPPPPPPPPSHSTETAGASSAANARATRDDASERKGRDKVIDVDVGKLPTFVFFFGAGDGKLWREDVVGGGNARACEAKLQKVMASGAGAGQGPGGADVVGGGGRATGDHRDDAVDTHASSGGDGGSGGVSSVSSRNTNNILEIRSRDDLLRVLSARRKGQGPVVVMYHAPWCRKCAYLTPVFRRLAAARMPGTGAEQPAASAGGVGESTSTTLTDEPILFCRADVSHPSWGRSAESGATDADSEGAAAATKLAGDSHVGGNYGGAATSMTPHGAHGAEVGETEDDFLHTGLPAMETCEVCMKSGFVPCGECEGKGAVARSSPDGKHTMAVTCPVCVGYKRLRCPSCGGKCFMCD